ncbi:hypothetical protein [Shimia sp.]|uniref:phage portal protein family protein n=1 Tax=Shimia sp. TaxID=1954381 RepID=UPI00329813AC
MAKKPTAAQVKSTALSKVRAPTPSGRSGLRQYSGTVREDFLPELTGRKGREIYLEMSSNSAVIGGAMGLLKNLLRAADWRVVPADNQDQRAVEAAELMDGMIHDMAISWPDQVAAVASFFDYGFSLHEVEWKKREGRKAAGSKSQPSLMQHSDRLGYLPQCSRKSGRSFWMQQNL